MTLRLGLLSTARINDQILRGAAETDAVEVVAVASRDPARAEAYARERGLARAHGSYEALLADPELDAVYVALPNALHAEWAIRALEAGKHVLVEKPFSPRPDAVEAAFAVAERGGRVLTEAFMYRHHPQTARIVELVREGAIGRLRSIQARFAFRLTDPANIRAARELGGGALLDLGCYCVSGARLLAGEPERVQAEVVPLGGVDGAFHGTLRFPGDVVAQFEASFLAPLGQRLEAAGEEGALVVEAPWRQDWGGDVLVRRGDEVERIEIPEANAYTLELEDFAAAIRGEREPLLRREDALGQARTLAALVAAADASAR
jgi:predicted dehydrogenase